jgi:Smg protein
MPDQAGRQAGGVGRDILDELSWPGARGDPRRLRPDARSPARHDPLLDAMGHDPVSAWTPGARTGWPASACNGAAARTRARRQVARLPGGLFQRRPGLRPKRFFTPASRALGYSGFMFDVLVYLYENYWRPDACPDHAQLTRKLSRWASSRRDPGGAELARRPGAAPSPTSGEQSERQHCACTPRRTGASRRESIGFISFLESAGVLPPPMREMVIDRAMACQRRAPDRPGGPEDHRADGVLEPGRGARRADPRRTVRRPRGPADPLRPGAQEPLSSAGARIDVELGQRAARGAHGQRLVLRRHQQAGLQEGASRCCWNRMPRPAARRTATAACACPARPAAPASLRLR